MPCISVCLGDCVCAYMQACLSCNVQTALLHKESHGFHSSNFHEGEQEQFFSHLISGALQCQKLASSVSTAPGYMLWLDSLTFLETHTRTHTNTRVCVHVCVYA